MIDDGQDSAPEHRLGPCDLTSVPIIVGALIEKFGSDAIDVACRQVGASSGESVAIWAAVASSLSASVPASDPARPGSP